MISTPAGISFRHVLLVFLIFLPLPSIGTLLHELGHAAVAWTLGRDVTIHYGSMNHTGDLDDELDALWHRSQDEIRSNEDSPVKRAFQKPNS